MIDDKKTATSVMEKIEQGKVMLKPKWSFLLKNYTFWALGLAALLVGGAASSVIIFTLVNSDFDVYRYLNGSGLKYIFIVLPYVWFIFFTLFIIVAYYNIKHTKHGYRYKLYIVVLTSLAASVILGIVLYCFGFSHAIDSSFGKHFPGQKPFIEKKQELLVQPEKGLLAGTIISVDDKDSFELEDFKGKKWTIISNELQAPHKPFLEKFSNIIIVGEEMEDDNFKACSLRPMHFLGENGRLKKERIKRDEGRFPNKERSLRSNDPREQSKKNNNIDERILLRIRSNECGTDQPQ